MQNSLHHSVTTPTRRHPGRLHMAGSQPQCVPLWRMNSQPSRSSASIGSADTPSPSGTVTIERIALDPGYTYNPKVNFQQGNNTKVLQIPPGPNGPVGTVWLALSKPTYGIHGTPDPETIGRAQSSGCVRLTNWDAARLAQMVRPGVEVEFVA